MIKKFDTVIYPANIWIIVDKDPKIISKYFLNPDGSTITNIDNVEEFLAFTIQVLDKENEEYGVLIFFRAKHDITFEVAAHESSHAAKMIFRRIGAEVEPHEPFEFLLGWIAGCCEKVKKGKE